MVRDSFFLESQGFQSHLSQIDWKIGTFLEHHTPRVINVLRGKKAMKSQLHHEECREEKKKGNFIKQKGVHDL